MNRLATLYLVALACGCTPHEVRPEVPNGPIDCDKACANMQAAGCVEGDPTPKKHKPCTEWCDAYHKPSFGMPPWAGCVAAAGADPERIESCNMSCTRK